MKREFRYAYEALKKLGVPVYVRDDMDGRFQISAEESESDQWCDYYQYMREDCCSQSGSTRVNLAYIAFKEMR
jgi:hypothetical protein